MRLRKSIFPTAVSLTRFTKNRNQGVIYEKNWKMCNSRLWIIYVNYTCYIKLCCIDSAGVSGDFYKPAWIWRIYTDHYQGPGALQFLCQLYNSAGGIADQRRYGTDSGMGTGPV